MTDEDTIEEIARELCSFAELDPDVWTIVGFDNWGAIREQNWEMYREDAEDIFYKRKNLEFTNGGVLVPEAAREYFSRFMS